MLTRNILIALFLILFMGPAGAADPAMVDLQGKTHQLSDYRGKWVVVNYWATWCPPCRDELPELVDFHEKYSKDSAVVLGINLEQIDQDFLRNFVDENFISYPVLLGSSSSANLFGKVMALPTTFVLDPNGRMVARRVGGVTMRYLEKVIKQDVVRLQARVEQNRER